MKSVKDVSNAVDPSDGLLISVGEYPFGAWEPRPDLKKYFDAAKEGKFLIKKCDGCGAYMAPIRICCSNCLSQNLSWVTSKGDGKVYSFTVVNFPLWENLKDKVPYVTALVELDEGIHVIANMTQCKPSEAKIGMRVHVVFDDDNQFEVPLPKFAPS